MLVGIAATSIGSQSCTNRSGICRTSGWRRAMDFEVGWLFEIGRQSADHRASGGRFQRTACSTAGLEVPPVGRPSPDARSMSRDYLSMLVWLETSGKRRKILTCPDGCRLEAQMTGRHIRYSSDHRPKMQFFAKKPIGSASEPLWHCDSLCQYLYIHRYRWERNGLPFNPDAGRIFNHHNGTGTLTFNPAFNEDQGYYQCFAENGYGVSLSVKTHLIAAKLDVFPEGRTRVIIVIFCQMSHVMRKPILCPYTDKTCADQPVYPRSRCSLLR